MKFPSMSLLAIAMAALLAGGAAASDPARATAAESRELAQAHEALRKAAARVAELSREQAEIAQRMHAQSGRAHARPMVGLLLAGDDRPGVRVTGVTPDGAAAKAGLRSGDRLLSVDGVQILGSNADLRLANTRKLLGALSAGKAARLGYEREGRTATVTVTPATRTRALALATGEGGRFEWLDDGQLERAMASAREGVDAGLLALESVPGLAPDVRREILRISRDRAGCSGEDCRTPRLLSAFRWTGLNLAAVDAQLGRYFGTDHGVLVLSTGELEGLQAGDVIHRVDGKAVATPREVMAQLRGKDDGARVPVEYLRDRKAGHAEVVVPTFTWPPPAPPAPPAPPVGSPPAPAKPPAPPAPPRAPAVAEAPPPSAPALPLA